MTNYKVKVTKHTKYEDILKAVKNDQEALNIGSESITISTPIKEESVTIQAEQIEEEADNFEGLNIPPEQRTPNGKVKEGMVCPTCRKIYIDADNTEAIIKGIECMACDHMRGELADLHKGGDDK